MQVTFRTSLQRRERRATAWDPQRKVCDGREAGRLPDPARQSRARAYAWLILSAGPLLAEWAPLWPCSIFKVSDRKWSSANWLLHFPKSLGQTEKSQRSPHRHPTSSFDARSLYQVFPATASGPGRSASLREVVRSREAGPTGRAGLAPGCGTLCSTCQESVEIGRQDL